MKNTLVEPSDLMYNYAVSDYPVFNYKEEILNLILRYQVVSICANTGAGKSTLIPLFLLEAGYKYIVITVPSRTAAVSLATRVASLLGSTVGDIVGYHTGYERAYSHNTRILYTTEGLELMKVLHNCKSLENCVLIIDELQEWSINVETLIAWIKYIIKFGWNSKVVMMSATMDIAGVSKFFNNSPIHTIPGKLYEVKEYERPANEFVTSIFKLASEKHNVLAFVPGKREIDKTITALTKMGLDAIMLKLHGDLPLDEQQAVFNPTDKPKVIIATNIAQTSITIPDIDAVVDSGLERHMEMVDGLEALNIGLISRSDYLQRKGRAGRTKPGIYVWCNDTPLASLSEYPTPDIYTGCISQIVLKLASIGVDATEVEFFHQPPIEKIHASQQTLRTLGAFDESNHITKIGEIMAQLPLSVRYARMIVEAKKYGVIEEVLTIAALSEFGGIKRSSVSYNKFSKEIRSDLLAELDCFNTVKARMYDYSIVDPFEGVIERNYFRVLELRTKLYDILTQIYGSVESTSPGNRNAIIRACASGLVEFLYVREGNGWYVNPNDPYRRKLNLYSTVLPGKYILGLPRNISLTYKGDNGQQTLYLISSAIMVDPDILCDVAPQMIRTVERKEFNYDKNEYQRRTVKMFGDVEIDSTDERINNFVERQELLVDWLAKCTIDEDWRCTNSKLERVIVRNREKLYDYDEAKDFYKKALNKTFKHSLPNIKKVSNYNFLLA